MIYLIGEIILYLLAALLVGAGAGWLLCDWRSGQSVDGEADLLTVPGSFAVGPAPAVQRVTQLEAELAEARACAAQLDACAEARAQEIGALTRRLTGAERRMQELEHERALQNRALQVLHQQLELAIERRGPQPTRASGTAA